MPSKKRSAMDLDNQRDANPKSRKKRKIDQFFAPSTVPKSKNPKHEQYRNAIMQQRVNTANDPQQYPFDETRIHQSESSPTHGIPPGNKRVSGVVYWMQRDQRVQDNWAMIYAQKMALQHKVPLSVVFCLLPSSASATLRHFDFMMKGLQQAEQELVDLQIPFSVLFDNPKKSIPRFATEVGSNLVVTDFNPLRHDKQCLTEVAPKLESINVHLTQVDAHNVVPVWVTSPKQEYAARTIRSKIHKNLNKYLVEFPPIVRHPMNQQLMQQYQPTDWKKASESLKVDMKVGTVQFCAPGTNHGLNKLFDFITKKLKVFEKNRNIPTVDALSNLSPYYHFGQIAPARAALEVQKMKGKYKESVEGYLEELIVRRELADNFCFYNQHYDKVHGAYQWAQDTLEIHENDEREYLYSLEELEGYQTHDDLWNAAQRQLVDEGKMHGFLRMYWAKKVLEWTENPKKALESAIYLNDKYSIDGRDPNGYVGCMWSICGIHDQGWRERPIFGKIRYMNYAGCKRKFKVQDFVAKMGVTAIKYTK